MQKTGRTVFVVGTVIFLAVLQFTSCCPGSCWAALMPMGITYNDASKLNEIHSVDLTTGQSTLLKSFKFDKGFWRFGSFAVDAMGKRAYALSSANNLYVLNLDDGTLAKVPLDPRIPFQALQPRGDGQLIGISYNKNAKKNEIRPVDPATGKVSAPLRSIRFDSGFWRLGTFSIDTKLKRLYVVSSANTLYKFNSETAAVLLKCPLGIPFQALQPRGDGLLIGMTYNEKDKKSELRTVDPATGDVSAALVSFEFDSKFWRFGTFSVDIISRRVFVMSSANTLHCFDATTGESLPSLAVDRAFQSLQMIRPKPMVILVPGLPGSQLFLGDTELFPKPIANRWKKLRYECEGSNCRPVTPGIKPGAPLALSYGSRHSGFIKSLIDAGYTLYDLDHPEGADFFPWGYDWRKSIEALADDLNQFITETVKPGTRKISIIAHSTGGLVTKTYLKKYGAQHIGQFIMAGVPHWGTLVAYLGVRHPKDLLFGDFLGEIVGISAQTIKAVTRNLPSMFQLMPGRNFIDRAGYLSDPQDLDGDNATGILDFAHTKNFLKHGIEYYLPNMGTLNPYLVEAGASFHEEMDGFLIPQGVETYGIVGSGIPTPALSVEFKTKFGHTDPYHDQLNCSGDGNVLLRSATAVESADYNTRFYFHDYKHGQMLQHEAVQELIVYLLSGVYKLEEMPTCKGIYHTPSLYSSCADETVCVDEGQ